MKIFCVLLVILVIGFSFISCGGSNNNMILLDQDVNFMDLIPVAVDYNKVIKSLDEKPDLNSINDIIGFEYYKQYSEGYYTLAKIDDGILLIDFDLDKNYKSCRKISFSDCSTIDHMNKLSTGDSLEKVRNIDRNGDYPFLYAGRTDYPKISYHFFNDGSVYVVSYDESFCILSLSKYIL